MQAQTLQDEPVVLREDRDGVAILRLNRPRALNALNAAMLQELARQFDAAEADPGVHGVVLTGAGEKAFAAGADIGAMADLPAAKAREWGQRGQALLSRIEHCRKPVVAALNGYALGGGLELAMACDWILACPEAKVGQPEVTIGVIPGFAGTQRLSRLVGPHAAKWLCMTGETIGAEEAQRLGIVLRIVPRAQLVDEAVKSLAKVKDNAPFAVALAKDVIDRGLNLPLDVASTLELDGFALTFATRDQKEGMRAFLDKRKPTYTGR